MVHVLIILFYFNGIIQYIYISLLWILRKWIQMEKSLNQETSQNLDYLKKLLSFWKVGLIFSSDWQILYIFIEYIQSKI